MVFDNKYSYTVKGSVGLWRYPSQKKGSCHNFFSCTNMSIKEEIVMCDLI